MRRLPDLFFGIFFLTLNACAQSSFEDQLNALYSGSVPLIYPDSLEKIMRSPHVTILDTRSREEYEVSHIEGALFIDYEEFDPEMVADIPKDSQIIVYCSVGYRSERIGEKLKKTGFDHVANLYGGIFEWKNTDHQVVDQSNQPTEKVHAYNALWSRWLLKGEKVYE